MLQRPAQRLRRLLVHALPVAAEDVLGLELRERPRRGQAQERVDAERLAAEREEVRHRPERVGADEHAPLGPPQRRLPPLASLDERDRFERADIDERDDVVRHAEPAGEGRAVARVAVEQLDHARWLTERAYPLVDDAVAVDRVDKPDAVSWEERVRGELQLRALGRDPAEAPLLLVDPAWPAQSLHQPGLICASPGPALGAPYRISSAPSGPPSRLRIVSRWMRTASNGRSSSTSSSSLMRALPSTST